MGRTVCTDDDVMVKNKRFAFPNDQFYLKSTAEMSAVFVDIPEALDNYQWNCSECWFTGPEARYPALTFRGSTGFKSQDDTLITSPGRVQGTL